MIFCLYDGGGGVGIAGLGYRPFGDREYGRRSVLRWVGCGAVGRVWGSLGASCGWARLGQIHCCSSVYGGRVRMPLQWSLTLGLLLLLPSSITLYSPGLRLSGPLVISTMIVNHGQNPCRTTAVLSV